MPGLLELSLCRHVVCDEREVEQAKSRVWSPLGHGRRCRSGRTAGTSSCRSSIGHVDGTGPMYSHHASPRARGMLYGPGSSFQSYLRSAGSMAARDKAVVTMIISVTDRIVDRMLSRGREEAVQPMELRRKMGSARTAMLCAVLIWQRGSKIVQHAAGPWSCMAAAY